MNDRKIISKRTPGLLLIGLALLFQGVQAEKTSAPDVTSTQTFEALKTGNARFISGHRQNGNLTARRQALEKEQKPAAIVLSCSDSRVPPELVFDQGLGDLFVIRVAGNGIDSAGLASIEYAVAHLAPKLLVVLGHSSCGAVKAALTTPKGQSAGSLDLDQLVASIQANLKYKPYPPLAEDPTMKGAADTQAQAVAHDLPVRSHIIQAAIEKGELKIVSGIYDLETGQVKFDQ